MPPALANPVLQLAIAAAFGAVGLYLLLPKPKIRSVAGGVFFTVAAVAVLGVFLYSRFGQPTLTGDGDRVDWIGSALFWLFSTAAVGFGVVLVAQRNPARGAIAFAFVILSTCGLFLLLAAPFLMAATIIIYAGAIVVTFLFVLMLSHVKGPSDENDRTREPLLGSLAGFAFVGLLLFTLHLSSLKQPDLPYDPPLPVTMLTAEDHTLLADASRHCDAAVEAKDWTEFRTHAVQVNSALERFLAPPDRATADERTRLSATDPRIAEFRKRTEALIEKKADLWPALNNPARQNDARAAVKALRDDLFVYRGAGRLPARNVANIGFLLYSEYLLAVEMAGTLLLVATIGAVAIAHRRKEVPA